MEATVSAAPCIYVDYPYRMHLDIDAAFAGKIRLSDNSGKRRISAAIGSIVHIMHVKPS
jgi:hypothetical protein